MTLENATSLKKSDPGPPNISDEDVSCTAPSTRRASLHVLVKRLTRAIVFETFAHFWQGAESLASKTISFYHLTCDLRTRVAPQRRALIFNISKCASHFFSVSTPNMVCFVRFDLEMCFAPQPHALFRVQRPKVLRA